MAAHLIQGECRVGRASESADSQVAIQSTTSIKPKSGRHLVDMFNKCFNTACRANSNLNLTIRWIAGHMKAEGNERADKLAKEATEGKCSRDSKLPPELWENRTLLISKLAIKQAFKKNLQKQARADQSRKNTLTGFN